MSNVVFLPDYLPLKMVSFESLLKFHRHRFGKNKSAVSATGRLGGWMCYVLLTSWEMKSTWSSWQHLKIPVRTLDSSHTKDELKKVLHDRLRLLKIHKTILYSRGCGECRKEVQGEKTEQAPCCRWSYHTACI